jgi:transposase
MSEMPRTKNVGKERGRWSAKAKREAVLRLLRGEAIDALSRELKVTAAKLSEWREAFLAGGEGNLKSRESDARDEEITRLKQTLGEMTLRVELQRDAIRRLKAGLPLDEARLPK